MENMICVDTDIIIDHLRGKGPGVEFFEAIVRKASPFTTYINRFELLCGARDKKEIKVIEECLLGFTILSFDEASSEEAARIYRELKIHGRLIGIRDIMIAGVSIANKAAFATKNIREYERVKGLRLISMADL